MKPISLAEYYAGQIEKFGGYPAESLAEDIIESIRLGSAKERVELTNEEFWTLYDGIVKAIKDKIEPLAEEMTKDWDSNARDDRDEIREGFYGRY